MTHTERQIEALRAYVQGDSSEPVVIAAFRDVPADDRTTLFGRHRDELSRINQPRLVMLESMLLPLESRGH